MVRTGLLRTSSPRLNRRSAVLDGEMRGLLESGCSLVVGVLTPSGDPFATRAWSLEVIDPAQGIARLLAGAGDLDRVGRSWDDLAGTPVALTGADVRTFHSVQVKGTVEQVEAVTPADKQRAARHTDLFFEAVTEVDLTPREVLDRMRPADLVALVIRVVEAYDQTPGPGAGAQLRRPS
jgi:hypothetical protein